MNIAYKLTSPPVKNGIKLESQGNFGYQKALVVEPIRSDIPITDGIIIQFVNKTTIMQDSTGTIYNTSDAISQYTSGNVNFSNDSYFEYWPIDANGRAIDDDLFGNNSLVEYTVEDGEYVPETYNPKSRNNDVKRNYQKYKTQGTITINSMSCFIADWNPLYNQIINLEWKVIYHPSALPANGLPYLEYTPEIYNYIFNNRNSNLLQHNVTVNWTFDNPKSVMDKATSKPKEIMSGGRYKKSYKHSRKHARKHARKHSRKYLTRSNKKK
ncbi:hypothetical protein N8261_06315 [Flavobacteriaceae bacterium]|nr:hypothetical protein [Flavobacteriaceae bacterium]